MSVRSERGDYTAEARRLGANRAAALDGLGPAVENLSQLIDAMDGEAMRDLVTYHTDQMRQDAQSRAAAIGSGRYRTAIRQRVFTNNDGYAGTVFVVLQESRRKSGGMWPTNTPLWLEYGTRKARAFPHLLPALAAARERFSRAVERLLQAKAAG